MTITLDLSPFLTLGDDGFYELCRRHPELKLERTAHGELVIMPPTGGSSGNKNSWLNHRLMLWAAADKSGLVFDSSTMFKLPSGAQRGPDAAWITRQRWEGLTPEQQAKFPPLCPDFVVELVSPSDSLPQQRAKMEEWLENGVRLGWLIDPLQRRAEIYRPGQPAQGLDQPTSLSGEEVLPGLQLDLTDIL